MKNKTGTIQFFHTLNSCLGSGAQHYWVISEHQLCPVGSRGGRNGCAHGAASAVGEQASSRGAVLVGPLRRGRRRSANGFGWKRLGGFAQPSAHGRCLPTRAGRPTSGGKRNLLSRERLREQSAETVSVCFVNGADVRAWTSHLRLDALQAVCQEAQSSGQTYGSIRVGRVADVQGGCYAQGTWSNCACQTAGVLWFFFNLAINWLILDFLGWIRQFTFEGDTVYLFISKTWCLAILSHHSIQCCLLPSFVAAFLSSAPRISTGNDLDQLQNRWL